MNETYEQVVQRAVQAHETACATARSHVNSLTIQLMANKDKARAQELRSELVMAEASLSCITASADQNKIAAIQLARRERETALSPFVISLS